MISDDGTFRQQSDPRPRRKKKKRRGDWVRLYRRLLKSPIFGDPGLLKVAIWALLKARFGSGVVTIRSGAGFAQVVLEAGQFITGRASAARELGMPESSVRNRLRRLVTLDFLTVKVDRGFSVVTIKNWMSYQRDSDSDGQTTGQPEDNPRTQKNNEKNVGKNESKRTGPPESGSWKAVTTEMLRDPAATEAWRIASNKRFGNFASIADRLLVQSAAAHAIRIGGNPVGVFVGNFVAGRDFVTNDDEAVGRQRLREIDAFQPSPALVESGIDPGQLFQSGEFSFS